MANSAQAKKRIRQNLKHHAHNVSLRSLTRTHLKKTAKALAAGDQQAASEAYKATVPVLDKMVSKGIIHKNKAARHKSRLNKHLKTMASAAPSSKGKEKTKSKAKTANSSVETPPVENSTPAE